MNYILEIPGASACVRAGLWAWAHGDLVDRVLASIAAETGLVLVHTDRTLRTLGGFPQKYFANLA